MKSLWHFVSWWCITVGFIKLPWADQKLCARQETVYRCPVGWTLYYMSTFNRHINCNKHTGITSLELKKVNVLSISLLERAIRLHAFHIMCFFSMGYVHSSLRWDNCHCTVCAQYCICTAQNGNQQKTNVVRWETSPCVLRCGMRMFWF